MIRLLLTSLSSTHQHQPLEWHGRPTSGMVRFCSRPPTMRKDITFMELKLTWMSDNETKKTPDPNRRVRLTYLLGYALRTYLFHVWLPDPRSQPHRTQWNSQQSDNITDTMKVKIYSSKIRRGNISIIAYVLNTYNIYNTMSINLCWAHRNDTTRSSREEEDATSTKDDAGCAHVKLFPRSRVRHQYNERPTHSLLSSAVVAQTDCTRASTNNRYTRYKRNNSSNFVCLL